VWQHIHPVLIGVCTVHSADRDSLSRSAGMWHPVGRYVGTHVCASYLGGGGGARFNSRLRSTERNLVVALFLGKIWSNIFERASKMTRLQNL